VPVNSRAAVRMTIIPVGGDEDGKPPILGRRGEAVGYCVYAMYRRKDIYGQDAEDFRPGRWESDVPKNVGWAHLPFKGEPRIHLRQDYAPLEAS
ncbi:n-alkane inducible cytochrome P-450, partial [Zopfia rhizophila CBS 207.26]